MSTTDNENKDIILQKNEIEQIDSENTIEISKKIDEIKEKININDSTAILSYGASAQRKTSDFVSGLLSNIKTKDFGEAGGLLNNLLVDVQGFDSLAISKGGFLSRMFSSVSSRLEKMQNSYRSVEKNIDKVIDKLENHRMTLMKDIAIMDKLYENNMNYTKELKLYIDAGEQKLATIINNDIPALKSEVEKTSDQVFSQRYNDLVNAANRFEKKLHDLKLTRTVAIQMLPQIRMQQENNSLLVEKIHSSIVNTIPLWKSQMVMALGLANTQNALKAQQAVTKTTNDLLAKNSEMLKTNTIEIAKESERSIIDINVIKKANEDIITSLEQVISIQAEGRQKRKEVEAELVKIEQDLKDGMMRATGR